MTVEIIVEIILLAISIVLLSGKGVWLIAGYNTASEKERAKFDKKKLCRTVGLLSLFITIALALQFHVFVGSVIMTYIDVFAITISIIMTIIYANTKCKIKVQKDAAEKAYESPLGEAGGFRKTAASVGIAILIMGFSAYSMISGGELPVYTVSSSTFTISGTYGETINISDITDIALKSALPSNLSRTYGYAGFGSVFKGHWSSSIGNIMLFADTSKPPFIYLTTTTKIYVFNDQTPEKTQVLHDQLNAVIKKT